jgi:hypothetical protein
MFCAPGLISDCTDGARSTFQVLRSQARFGGTEGVESPFHVLRSRVYFRRYRGRRTHFSCFAPPDSFLVILRASCSLSCFAFTDSFSAVLRASGLLFMFCALRFIFGGTEGVGSRFNVLCTRIYFRRYRGRCVLFSSFALPGSFWAVPRALCPLFIFCAPRFILGGNEGVRSTFHTRFRRYRGRQV